MSDARTIVDQWYDETETYRAYSLTEEELQDLADRFNGHGTTLRSLSLEGAAQLLRRWQLNEWALDKKMTKKALKEQRQIIKDLLTILCQRHVVSRDVDFVMGHLN